MKEIKYKEQWRAQTPLTKEDMEFEISTSRIVEPHNEFDEKSINETLRALNLEDKNVPTQDSE